MSDNAPRMADIFTEMMEMDAERDELLEKIDNAIACDYEVPAELSALPWIKKRKMAQTHLADALHAAVRPFATRPPNLQIQPLSEETAESNRVEQLEDAMMWEFNRMNRNGPKSPHWEIVEHAMRYNRVAINTQYLPWEYQDRKGEPRIKFALRARRFNWNVHHPATVHERYSDLGLEGVLKCCQMSAQDLIELHGEDNPGIREMIRQLAVDAGNGYGVLSRDALDTYYTYVDYIDWNTRFQAAVQSDTLLREFSGFDYIVRDEPHSLSFIPWVIVNGGPPILQSVVESGMWDNYLHMKTIEFSRAIALAAAPNLWIKTTDGTLRQVSIDYTNPVQPIVTEYGTEVAPLPPPPIDQNFSKILQETEAQIYASTTARVLADISRYSASALGTVQTIVQAAVAQLAASRLTIERAEALAYLQNFYWIEQSGISLVTFRSRSASEEEGYLQRGAEVIIKAGQANEEDAPNIVNFDLDHLYISVSVEPEAIVDRQARLNEAIQKVANLGASRTLIYDEYDLGIYALHEAKRAEEDLDLAELKANSDRIVGKAQLELQQAAMQMQMQMQTAMQQAQAQQAQQAQAQAPANQVTSLNAGGQYASMQGVNTNAGGIAPQTAAPMETRETLTGQTNQGGQMA